jgi:organic radical activating enzyme
LIYQVAERFKAVQGEGTYAGTPMAFIRFVGCSVGKRVCHGCDTDFEKIHEWHGGGSFSRSELLAWAEPYQHICLTGGEPLNQDILPFLQSEAAPRIHLETSGTIVFDVPSPLRRKLWICVSPKPGFRSEMIGSADEIKVIVPGLGNGEGWPTLQEALQWADFGRNVFLQPRNEKHTVSKQNLSLVVDMVKAYPQLKLSVQLHKLLGER